MNSHIEDGLETIYDDLLNFLKDLNDLYKEMGRSLPAPAFSPNTAYKSYRHPKEQHTDTLACHLKGIKAISTLNASIVLMKHGYVQEVGALCRMIDDFCSEIFFLLVPGNEDSLDQHQEKFLTNFYQEEFSDFNDPLYSHQSRESVPIGKIHAAFAKYAKDGLNTSDIQTISKVIHRTFSGYVHGAYPQIMEMYGGNPPQFHALGMLDSPRGIELVGHIVGYVDKLILLTIFISRKSKSLSTDQPLTLLKRHFENTFSTKRDVTPAQMLMEYKKQRAKQKSS